MPKQALRLIPRDGAAPALPAASDAAAGPSPVSLPKRRRDSRIDVLRGIALVMIFVNHVPGTVFELATTRNFGFSDAAEGFVFLSGLSAVLAYAGGLAARPLWPGIRRIWKRAWTLYLVHLMVTFWALAIVAATLRYGGNGTLFGKDNFQFLVSDPLGVLIGLPVLGHQFGYVNILPLYAALLLAAPAMIMAAVRWPLATLGASVALWTAAGLTHFDLPNLPLPGGWFFNPFAWQLLFVLGILTGVALKRGARFVPANRWLVIAATAYLLLALVWLKWPALQTQGNAMLGWAAAQGVPNLIRDFDKTYVSVPRLLHFLSLAYVLSVLPWLRAACDSRPMAPLALLGRHALPVFALGTVLSFAVRAAKEVAGEAPVAFDAMLISGGIAAMLVFAAMLEISRKAGMTPIRAA
ncbi:OpgC family protein [Albidovulum sp.]|uniref:OpgC family protein n=1 Tax=Albidovulum sp. TaxID=1872424 RepID=UPI0039B967A1